MQLLINGKKEDVQDGLSISTLLKEKEVEVPETVSVELNGEIVDRDDYDNIVLKQNDEVELIYMMGGGQL